MHINRYLKPAPDKLIDQRYFQSACNVYDLFSWHEKKSRSEGGIIASRKFDTKPSRFFSKMKMLLFIAGMTA